VSSILLTPTNESPTNPPSTSSLASCTPVASVTSRRASASAPGSTYFSRSGVARARDNIFSRDTYARAHREIRHALPSSPGRYSSRTWSSLDAGWRSDRSKLSLSLSLSAIRAFVTRTLMTCDVVARLPLLFAMRNFTRILASLSTPTRTRSLHFRSTSGSRVAAAVHLASHSARNRSRCSSSYLSLSLSLSLCLSYMQFDA